jgi:hypothetical protein
MSSAASSRSASGSIVWDVGARHSLDWLIQARRPELREAPDDHVAIDYADGSIAVDDGDEARGLLLGMPVVTGLHGHGSGRRRPGRAVHPKLGADSRSAAMRKRGRSSAKAAAVAGRCLVGTSFAVPVPEAGRR